MANFYVRSAAAGAGTGADWANAFTTLTAALSGRAATDVIWVANDHSESTAGAVTLTCPTTPGLQILGVNTNSTEPPTALNSTPAAIVAVGASNSELIVNGFAYINAITFNGGTNASSSCRVSLGVAATPHGLVLDNCALVLRTASSTAFMPFGSAASSSSDDVSVRLINTTLKFGNAGQSLTMRGGRMHFKNVTLDSSGSTPTTLITGANACNGSLLWEDSDLSGEAFTNLVNQSTFTSTYDITFRNCKLPASIVPVTGAHPGPGGLTLRMHNCDSADTHIRFEEDSYQGVLANKTGAWVRTGGATAKDGTAFSVFVFGVNANFFSPLRCIEFARYNNVIGSSQAAIVEILRDSVTNLTNANIWLELSYLGTSGVPQGTIGSDRAATIMTTPADHASSSVTWDTTGMANPKKQKLSVTFTAQEEGWLIGRVMVAINSSSIYVDPIMTVGAQAAGTVDLLPGFGLVELPAGSGGGITRARLPAGMSGMG